MISVLVPTLGRAAKLAAVAANIHQATVTKHEVIFIAEQWDSETHEAVWHTTADRLHVNFHRNCYTGALNSAFPDARGEYIFTAADDLRFHHGWDQEVLSVMKDGTLVGGTNDLLNAHVLAGVMATHMLIARSYVEDPGAVEGEPGGMVMYEGYGHHFGESELVSTALHRGVFAPCLGSVVEHMHWTKTGQRDETTALNEAREGGDHELCVQRLTALLGPEVMASEDAYLAWARGRLKARGVL